MQHPFSQSPSPSSTYFVGEKKTKTSSSVGFVENSPSNGTWARWIVVGSGPALTIRTPKSNRSKKFLFCYLLKLIYWIEMARVASKSSIQISVDGYNFFRNSFIFFLFSAARLWGLLCEWIVYFKGYILVWMDFSFRIWELDIEFNGFFFQWRLKAFYFYSLYCLLPHS